MPNSKFLSVQPQIGCLGCLGDMDLEMPSDPSELKLCTEPGVASGPPADRVAPQDAPHSRFSCQTGLRTLTRADTVRSGFIFLLVTTFAEEGIALCCSPFTHENEIGVLVKLLPV